MKRSSDLDMSFNLEDQLKVTAKQLDLALVGCGDICKTRDYSDDYSADSDPDIDTNSLAKELHEADRGELQDKIGKRLLAYSAHVLPVAIVLTIISPPLSLLRLDDSSSDESSTEGSPFTCSIKRKRRAIVRARNIGNEAVARVFENAVERMMRQKAEEDKAESEAVLFSEEDEEDGSPTKQPTERRARRDDVHDGADDVCA